MENKIEYKIIDDKIVVYFYGELKKILAKRRNVRYIPPCRWWAIHGKVAQLVRACGSYPQCRGFKSLPCYQKTTAPKPARLRGFWCQNPADAISAWKSGRAGERLRAFSSLKCFAFQTIRPVVSRKKRSFSAHFWPGGAVPPPSRFTFFKVETL